MAADLLELESSIKELPGVLGCAIFTNPDGSITEIQAFTRAGADQDGTQRAILSELAARSLHGSLKKIFVYELETESLFGDRDTLERAVELAEQEARIRGPVERTPADGTQLPSGSRAMVVRVVHTSTEWTSQAEVALGSETEQAVGQATGEKTTHGLSIVAQAALDAVSRLVEGANYELVGASLVTVLGHEAVAVLVRLDGGVQSLGAALVRTAPVPEAAVRATLDAVNRRLAFSR
ncbi:MAG: hypothetical protein ACRDJI_12045 [Actinomycetota bacterium]